MEFNSFEKTVVVIALLVLMVTLIIMGMALKKPTASSVTAASCPDFWFSSYYTPCASTDGGCCPDGVTPRNAANNHCKRIPEAPYGMCDDGYTPKKEDGTCPVPEASKCYNVKGLGVNTGSCAMVDFSDPKYTGSAGLCEKQKFAESCKVSWEGISNLPTAC